MVDLRAVWGVGVEVNDILHTTAFINVGYNANYLQHNNFGIASGIARHRLT